MPSACPVQNCFLPPCRVFRVFRGSLPSELCAFAPLREIPLPNAFASDTSKIAPPARGLVNFHPTKTSRILPPESPPPGYGFWIYEWGPPRASHIQRRRPLFSGRFPAVGRRRAGPASKTPAHRDHQLALTRPRRASARIDFRAPIRVSTRAFSRVARPEARRRAWSAIVAQTTPSEDHAPGKISRRATPRDRHGASLGAASSTSRSLRGVRQPVGGRGSTPWL